MKVFRDDAAGLLVVSEMQPDDEDKKFVPPTRVLYAARRFAAGEVVTRFDGQIVPNSNFFQTLLTAKEIPQFLVASPMYSIVGLGIPANGRGLGSFAVEFRDDPRMNNTVFKFDTNRTEPKVFLIATRVIQPGEPIGVTYGKDYWDEWFEWRARRKRWRNMDGPMRRLVLAQSDWFLEKYYGDEETTDAETTMINPYRPSQDESVESVEMFSELPDPQDVEMINDSYKTSGEMDEPAPCSLGQIVLLDEWRGQPLATIGNGVSVRRSNIPGAGSGLFADRLFPRGAFITQFDGELVDNLFARVLRDNGLATHVLTLAPMHTAIHGIEVAIVGRGGASLANDAGFRPDERYDGRRNNSKFVKVSAMDGIDEKILLRAVRDIRAGEEITVSYEAGYWRIHAAHTEVIDVSSDEDETIYIDRRM